MAHKTTKEELDDTLKDMHRQLEDVRENLMQYAMGQMRQLSVLESYIFRMTKEVTKLPDKS